MNLNSPNGKRQEPLSKERFEAAHAVYLDMISDPSLNFSQKNKERIQTQFRSSSEKDQEKIHKIKPPSKIPKNSNEPISFKKK